jgi:hypothetical protein
MAKKGKQLRESFINLFVPLSATRSHKAESEFIFSYLPIVIVVGDRKVLKQFKLYRNWRGHNRARSYSAYVRLQPFTFGH